MKNKRQSRTHTSTEFDTITAGAAGSLKGQVTAVKNLSTLVEGILALEGAKPKVQSIQVQLRAYSEENFTLSPFIVQTAGTITDTVDIDAYIQDLTLDPAIDDVFGFQSLGITRNAKRVPSMDASGASGKELAIETTILIPGNVLEIINKEAETERLQNLYLVLITRPKSNNQVIEINTLMVTDFVVVRKGIVLR